MAPHLLLAMHPPAVHLAALGDLGGATWEQRYWWNTWHLGPRSQPGPCTTSIVRSSPRTTEESAPHVPGSGRRLVGKRTGGSMLAVAMLGPRSPDARRRPRPRRDHHPWEVARSPALSVARRPEDLRRVLREGHADGGDGAGIPKLARRLGLGRGPHHRQLMVSDASAFGRVAKVTRVCTYDRPGIIAEGRLRPSRRWSPSPPLPSRAPTTCRPG